MSRAYARRLLSALDLPREAGRLIEEPKYHLPAVFEEVSRIYDGLHIVNPREGLQLARMIPQLAEHIDPHGLHPSYRLRGYAILGASYRVLGDFAESKRAFSQGLTVLDECSPLAQVDFYRRYASLPRDQRQFDTALSIVERGIALFRKHGDLVHRRLFGTLLIARAQIYFEQGKNGCALKDLSESLNHFDPIKHQTYYYAVLHNLCAALVSHCDLESTGRALACIQDARRQLAYKPENFARWKLRWLEGLASIKFGSSRQGERLLRRARSGMIKLELPQEVALVSLDLALLLHREGRIRELQHISAETYELFAHLSVDREALAALKLWTDAVETETVTAALLTRIRSQLAKTGIARRPGKG